MQSLRKSNSCKRDFCFLLWLQPGNIAESFVFPLVTAVVSGKAIERGYSRGTLVSTKNERRDLLIGWPVKRVDTLGNTTKGDLKDTISRSVRFPTCFPASPFLPSSSFFFALLSRFLHQRSRSWENSLTDRVLPCHVFAVHTAETGENLLYARTAAKEDGKVQTKKDLYRRVAGKCHANIIYLWTSKGWWMRRCVDEVCR